ncbi:UNVERIFIED_CONTAM: hypothetical protein GTU68_008417 [Idotea baltica]|nr:hypothetical protein [Idotea baltica]
MKIHNFSAGPSILPQTVIQQMANAIVEYGGTGLSILELSHRGEVIEEMIAEAHQLVRELLNLPDNYAPMFLTGGATTQFALIPCNLLAKNGVAAYTDTGTWSTKAIDNAKHYGKVDVVASSANEGFIRIPKGYEIPQDASYFHVTSNNTIYGTQLKQTPDAGKVPLVIDMSSDIFSTDSFNAEDYGLIYASAQKNLGPAGTTLVIVNQDLLGKTGREIPPMFDYRGHIKKQSALNTPPVLAIFGCLLTLRWIKQHGLAVIEKTNKAKADLIYNEIDNNPLLIGKAAKEDQSVMNATFLLTKPELETEFLQMATAANIVGIKGHRSVGGFRASMYNALTLESVEALVEVMQAFAVRFG